MNIYMIRRGSVLLLGVSSGLQVGLGVGNNNQIHFAAAGIMLVCGIALVVFPTPGEQGLRPAFHAAVAQNFQDFINEHAGFWQDDQAHAQAKVTVGDFTEQFRSLERKMFMKRGKLRNVWWHCYGGITNEQCDWGEGHYCMVIFGESSMPPGDMTDGIAPAGDWTTPLTYLKSFDHDPTDDEKEKITPPDYRTEPFQSEKVRRP